MQEQIVKYGRIVLPYILRFRFFAIGLAIIVVFFVAFQRIDRFSVLDKNEDRYEARVTEVQDIKFNSNAITEIRSLTDLGINIKSQFPTSRNNPF